MTCVRRVFYFFISVSLVWTAVFCSISPALAESERKTGYYTAVDDRNGRVIFRTGMIVKPGDKYLTQDNLFYRIARVRGLTAYANCLGRADLGAAAGNRTGFFARLFQTAAGFFSSARAKPGPVAIYHTHSDESYVPSDGTSSKPGKGGIYQVGQSIAQSLKQEGVSVEHSYADHDPHDGMAYERSRRTAADLLKRNPAALLDIHRDAGPRDEYAARINNNGVTQVQIVLGRSNPNLKANEAFAKQVKAIVDKKAPGLIKGIYYGEGKYNQDLSSRALLLELGTESNSKEAAERGAAIFADASRSVVAAAGASGPGGRFAAGGAWRSVLYIVGGVIALALVLLFLNSKGLGGAGRNLRKFFSQEFTSALGAKRRRSRRKRDDDPGDRG